VRRRRDRPTLEVFALEPGAVQVIVRAPDDRWTVSIDGDDTAVQVTAGVGAAVVEGLQPATSYEARLDGRPGATFRTLAEPPGAYLGRFATISDLHVGETGFGVAPRVRMSRNPATAHPVVCLRAALAELQDWGAEGLVVKGDISHDSRTQEYEVVAAELRGLPLPLWVIPGNHDGGNHHRDDGGPVLARHGITLHDRTTELKLGGLRVILANTPQWGQPGTTQGNSDFGVINGTQANSQRHVQFALRFMF